MNPPTGRELAPCQGWCGCSSRDAVRDNDGDICSFFDLGSHRNFAVASFIGLEKTTCLEAHMNRLIVSSACAVMLLTPLAHGQSLGEKTGVNSTLGITPTTQDFVTEAGNSDILELAAAKIAEDRGNAGEKKFAEQMTTDHTKTSKDLKAMIDGGDVKATIPVK